MAWSVFSEGLLEDIRLEPLFGIHLPEPGIFRLQFFPAGQQGDIHAAALLPPLVKRRCANAQISTPLRDRQSGFNALERILIWLSVNLDFFM